MKANELQIGDWVVGNNKQPFQIGVIDPSFRYWDEVEPIPLTPEILEKNGYTHDKLAEQALIAEGATQDTYFLISDDHRILINNASHNINSLNEWFIHVDTEDMRSMAGFEITYVHELQHALKLCGIEKEVVV